MGDVTASGDWTAVLMALLVVLTIIAAVAMIQLQRLREEPKSDTGTREPRPGRHKYGILKFSRIHHLNKPPNRFVVLDIEKSGPHHLYDRLIEVGIIQLVNGMVVDRFSKSQPRIDDVIHEIHARISDVPLIVGFNVESDLKFLHVALAEKGLSVPSVTSYDVADLVRETLPRNIPACSLDAVKSHFGITMVANRAVTDCDVILEIFTRCLKLKNHWPSNLPSAASSWDG